MGGRFPYNWLPRRWAIGAAASSGFVALIGAALSNKMRGPYELLLTEKFTESLEKFTNKGWPLTAADQFCIVHGENSKRSLYVSCRTKNSSSNKEVTKKCLVLGVPSKLLGKGQEEALNRAIISQITNGYTVLVDWDPCSEDSK